MQPTNTADPDYYHKVVDCQWACPAHTDVPEYIRLIAQGRYSDAYMVNRESNVFPGIPSRAGPLPGRLHGDPRVDRVPGHPGPRLRPPLRARLPAPPRRGEAGRDL